ncbi:MAG: HK97 gp10 family phage protein [Butyricicoccus sp.]
MARWGDCDFRELQELSERMERLSEIDVDRLCREVSNKVARILLNKVKKRTPVGVVPSMLTKEDAIYQQYWSGYVGGTLRDAWKVSVEESGSDYLVTLENPTEYASYVEYGHRQLPGRYVPALGVSLKANWVKGRFMMTISVQETQQMIPGMVEKAIYNYLKEVF